MPKQRPNDKRQTGMKRIFEGYHTDAKTWHSFLMRWPMRYSCVRAFRRLTIKNRIVCQRRGTMCQHWPM